MERKLTRQPRFPCLALVTHAELEAQLREACRGYKDQGCRKWNHIEMLREARGKKEIEINLMARSSSCIGTTVPFP